MGDIRKRNPFLKYSLKLVKPCLGSREEKVAQMKNFLSKVYKRRGKCELALEKLHSEWGLHFFNYFLLSEILIFSIVNLCGF